MSVYTDNGYKNRADYLECLAEDHGVSLDQVQALAELLGPSEDFDGLVTSIEDMGGMYDYDGQPDELTEWMDFDPDC